MSDLVVIGGGPAGVSCALYAKRYGLDVRLVADSIGGQVRYTHAIYSNPSAGHGIDTNTLIGRYEKSLKKEKVPIIIGRVQSVSRHKEDCFIVTHDKGELHAISVVVATGRRPRQITLPISPSTKRIKIRYFTDYPYKGVPKGGVAVVIGGGYSGLDMVEELYDNFRTIHMVEKSGRLGGNTQRRARVKNNGKIVTHTNAQILSIDEFDGCVTVTIESPSGLRKITADAIFVSIGTVPNTEFIDIVSKNESGEIIVNMDPAKGPLYVTSQKNIFACGDCTSMTPKGFEPIAVGQGIQCAEVAGTMVKGESW